MFVELISSPVGQEILKLVIYGAVVWTLKSMKVSFDNKKLITQIESGVKYYNSVAGAYRTVDGKLSTATQQDFHRRVKAASPKANSHIKDILIKGMVKHLKIKKDVRN